MEALNHNVQLNMLNNSMFILNFVHTLYKWLICEYSNILICILMYCIFILELSLETCHS